MTIATKLKLVMAASVLMTTMMAHEKSALAFDFRIQSSGGNWSESNGLSINGQSVSIGTSIPNYSLDFQDVGNTTPSSPPQYRVNTAPRLNWVFRNPVLNEILTYSGIQNSYSSSLLIANPPPGGGIDFISYSSTPSVPNPFYIGFLSVSDPTGQSDFLNPSLTIGDPSAAGRVSIDSNISFINAPFSSSLGGTKTVSGTFIQRRGNAAIPEPTTMLGLLLASGFGMAYRYRLAKAQKS
jgi:hypothetical protein